MAVKIITDRAPDTLERHINEWLNENTYRITTINYQMAQNREGSLIYSALIVYEG